MPILINRGKEIIRISPTNSAKLELSVNGGRTWLHRYQANSTTGQFSDLMDNGTEILGTTTKGLFFSRNNGRTWLLRKR